MTSAVIKSDFDTIFALSTPVGGALAVIRVSGAQTLAAVSARFDGTTAHRRCSFGHILDENGSAIDECTVTYFASPHSYTGEDCAEITVHGSYAVVNAVLGSLGAFGLRPAEAGEFTKRAFLNGKLDLCMAEAVMDIISSSTEAARRAASDQLNGGLSRRVNALYNSLTQTAAYIDAVLDFPDEMEDDLAASEDLAEKLRTVLAELETLINNGDACRVLREGARVVIFGRPNAGKSSLFNALLEHDRAIVSQEAGTTRDIVEERISVEGVPVVLVDTAGVRSAEGHAEAMGVDRALAELDRASLILAVFDSSSPLTEEDAALLERTERSRSIAVLTKADISPVISPDEDGLFMGMPAVVTSVISGIGLQELRQCMAMRLLPSDETAIVTNSRHIEALRSAALSLRSALCEPLPECRAADIRDAMGQLGVITGREVSDDIIDSIFATFCVGK